MIVSGFRAAEISETIGDVQTIMEKDENHFKEVQFFYWKCCFVKTEDQKVFLWKENVLYIFFLVVFPSAVNIKKQLSGFETRLACFKKKCGWVIKIQENYQSAVSQVRRTISRGKIWPSPSEIGLFSPGFFPRNVTNFSFYQTLRKSGQYSRKILLSKFSTPKVFERNTESWNGFFVIESCK